MKADAWFCEVIQRVHVAGKFRDKAREQTSAGDMALMFRCADKFSGAATLMLNEHWRAGAATPVNAEKD